jgi:hypothetical protein
MKGKIITLILCLTALTAIAQNNYVFQYKLRGGTNIQNFEKRHITSELNTIDNGEMKLVSSKNSWCSEN